MTPITFADISPQAPMWSVMEMLIRREAAQRIQATWRASRDVQGAHDRFRRCYLRNGVSLNLCRCRCMAHVDPHLHAPRKVRRIGHLPMLTLKELPE
jgi:hypothetical protein